MHFSYTSKQTSVNYLALRTVYCQHVFDISIIFAIAKGDDIVKRISVHRHPWLTKVISNMIQYTGFIQNLSFMLWKCMYLIKRNGYFFFNNLFLNTVIIFLPYTCTYITTKVKEPEYRNFLERDNSVRSWPNSKLTCIFLWCIIHT
jgi:hypothetical protein